MANPSVQAQSDLDRKLQELALTDWQAFKELIRLDTTSIEVCRRRKKGRSIRQIAAALKMGKSTVGEICKKCPPLPDSF